MRSCPTRRAPRTGPLTLMELSRSPLMIFSSSYCRQYTPLLFSERHWILCKLCRPHRQLDSIVWGSEEATGEFRGTDLQTLAPCYPLSVYTTVCGREPRLSPGRRPPRDVAPHAFPASPPPGSPHRVSDEFGSALRKKRSGQNAVCFNNAIHIQNIQINSNTLGHSPMPIKIFSGRPPHKIKPIPRVCVPIQGTVLITEGQH